MVLTDKYMRVMGTGSPGNRTPQTISGNPTVSENSVDLMDFGREIGTGEQILALFTIETALTAAGNVTFDIIVANDAALTTNIILCGSVVTVGVDTSTAGTVSGSAPGPVYVFYPGSRIVVAFNPQPIIAFDSDDPANTSSTGEGQFSATGHSDLQRYLGLRVGGATAGAVFGDFVLSRAITTKHDYPSGFEVR